MGQHLTVALNLCIESVQQCIMRGWSGLGSLGTYTDNTAELGMAELGLNGLW